VYLANSLPITSQKWIRREHRGCADDLYAIVARETLRHAESDPELRGAFELILRRLDDSWLRLELDRGDACRAPSGCPTCRSFRRSAGPRIEESLRAIVSEELASAAAIVSASFVEQGECARTLRRAARRRGHRPDIAVWHEHTRCCDSRLADLARWRGIAELTLS
jgi:hypothetical protein